MSEEVAITPSDTNFAILFTEAAIINKQSISHELETWTLHSDISESIRDRIWHRLDGCKTTKTFGSRHRHMAKKKLRIRNFLL